MRGWLAAIAKERLAQRQVSAYRELSSLFEFFAAFPIAPFDQAAADRFDSLQAAKVRIATRDLKIAAISLTNNALLLTANRRDFEKVPGLSSPFAEQTFIGTLIMSLSVFPRLSPHAQLELITIPAYTASASPR